MKCRGLGDEARRSESDLQRGIFQSVEGVITLTHWRACSGNLHSLRQLLLCLYSPQQNSWKQQSEYTEDLWMRARWATLPIFQTESVSNNALTKVSVTFFQEYYLCRICPPCVCGWRMRSSAVDTWRVVLLPAPRRTGIWEPEMETFFSSTRTRTATPLLRRASTALLRSVFVNANMHTSSEEEADKMCWRRWYMEVSLPWGNEQKQELERQTPRENEVQASIFLCSIISTNLQ